ncbi:MAG: DUF3572 domain-containing protein [Desulfobulbia bacterium]
MIINKSLKPRSNPELIEEIIAKALIFLAQDPEILSRFLDLTGLKPEEIRSQVSQHTFQSAIFEYLLADESLLLAFCSNCALEPASIQPAYENLRRRNSG